MSWKVNAATVAFFGLTYGLGLAALVGIVAFVRWLL